MECRMKMIIGILVFLSSAILHADNNQNGFGLMEWGEPIGKYKDVLHLTSEDNKLKKFYTVVNDQMLLDDIKLSSISYIFYKNKFSSVVIQTERASNNLTKALSVLKNQFGSPFYVNKYTNKYRWKNDFTTVDLKCFASSHKCSMIYHSVAMSDLEKSDNDAMANN